MTHKTTTQIQNHCLGTPQFQVIPYSLQFIWGINITSNYLSCLIQQSSFSGWESIFGDNSNDKSVRNYRQDLIQSKSCFDETPVEFITDTFRPDKIHHHNTEYIQSEWPIYTSWFHFFLNFNIKLIDHY